MSASFGSSQLLFPRQLHARRRVLELFGILPVGRDLYPPLGGLAAFLDDRKVECLASRQTAGQHHTEDELVVEVVRQIASAPGDLLHAFADWRTVEIIALRIFALDCLELPSR